MTLPDTAAVANRAGLSVNDPRAPIALSVALSWARGILARDTADALDDLNDSGNEAVLGAAVDFLKLPAMQAALIDPANDTLAVLPVDIGRRWETLLARGNKHLWPVR